MHIANGLHYDLIIGHEQFPDETQYYEIMWFLTGVESDVKQEEISCSSYALDQVLIPEVANYDKHKL